MLIALLSLIVFLLAVIAFPGLVTGCLGNIIGLVFIGAVIYVFDSAGLPVWGLSVAGGTYIVIVLAVRVRNETKFYTEVEAKLADLRDSGDPDLIYHASLIEQQLKDAKKEDRKRIVQETRARWDSMQASKKRREPPIRKN